MIVRVYDILLRKLEAYKAIRTTYLELLLVLALSRYILKLLEIISQPCPTDLS